MTAYTPKTERRINTGRGICITRLTPYEIATRRSDLIDSTSDRVVFMNNFARVRGLAVDVLDLEYLWTLAGGSYVSPVIEAAIIEALASLRAEGKLS